MARLLAHLLITLGVGAVVSTAIDTGAITVSSCASLGFDPSSLACSTCERLSAALGPSDASVASCQACCSRVLDWRSPEQFDDAVVIASRLSLSQFGGVSEFVEKLADSLGVDVVEGRPTQAPVLFFRNDNDDAESGGASVDIRAWKAEQIEALVRLKVRGLKNRTAAPDAASPQVGNGQASAAASAAEAAGSAAAAPGKAAAKAASAGKAPTRAAGKTTAAGRAATGKAAASA